MKEPGLPALLQVAMEAADVGGRRALGYFGTPVPVERKADGSAVTVADREAEAAIRGIIARAFPDHAILGEEGGLSPGDAPFRWIVDPIDGTKAFVRGVPLWGVLIGVEVRTEPLVGVIYLPALGEMIAAAHGQGCTWNGRPCRVSSTGQLEDALVVPTSVRACQERAPDGFAALMAGVSAVRTWGDCYGHALVATGRADVALDVGVAAWDLAAILPVIEEAGGLFTDWRGARTARHGEAISSNGLLHEAVLGILAPG